MYFNRSDRIRTLRRTLRVGLGAALLVSIIGRPAGAPLAQTSNSLRIRSMGNSFAGIIVDPHTDAYLNPARVGDLRDRQIYMARLPGESLIFYYPDNAGMRTYGNPVLPPETVPGQLNYPWPRSFTPYTIGFITPITGTTKLSFAVDAAADGYDELSNSDELRITTYTPGEDYIDIEGTTYGRDRSLYHVVADVAVGTGDRASSGTRIGVRLRVGYDQMRHGNVRISQRTSLGYPDITEMGYHYGYESETGEYENTRAEIQFGLFRNSWFITQAVLGVGGTREKLTVDSFLSSIDDDDYDENGRGSHGDATPLFRVDDDGYNAFRSYDSIYLFGRFGLKWSDRVRSFHRVTWGQSNGIGNGIAQQFYHSFEVDVIERYTAVSYDLDGNTKRFTTDHSVGFINTIGDNLEVALGVHAQIRYEEFEEDGDGTGFLSFTEGASSNTYETPYTQRATHKREDWILNLPIGVEWSFHHHMAWRFGTQVRATRLDNDGEIRRDIDLPDDPDLGENMSYQDIHQRITYGTSLYFSMGFGFTFWDRLSIDLLSAATTGSFNAANIASAQVKYYF